MVTYMIKIIISLIALIVAVYLILPRHTETIVENTGTITLPAIEVTIVPTVVPTIEPTPSPEPFIPTINYEENVRQEFENGILYEIDDGFIYLPNEINEDTDIVVYYPGYEGHPVIKYFYWFLEYYFEHFAPNAIMLFSEGSGYKNMEERNPQILEHVYQIRGQYNVNGRFVVFGSSLGAYAAMCIAAQDEEIVDMVACLDSGYDYNVPYLPTEEQINKIAEMGAKVYLFEQIGVDNTTFKFIQQLVDSGVEVYVVECRDGGHDAITEDAFMYDLFSWAIGDKELPENKYNLKELTSESDNNE